MKPIIFSTDSVKLIREGKKSVTRRVVKGRPPYDIGDMLWVREPFGYVLPDGLENGWTTDADTGLERPVRKDEMRIVYRADEPDFTWAGDDDEEVTRWKPAMFMPRRACRMFVQVTNLEVHSLQGMTERDAVLEGCRAQGGVDPFTGEGDGSTALDEYRAWWDDLNGKTYPWKMNPKVRAIYFKPYQEGTLHL